MYTKVDKLLETSLTTTATITCYHDVLGQVDVPFCDNSILYYSQIHIIQLQYKCTDSQLTQYMGPLWEGSGSLGK